jgi:ATP-dependent helicase/nuclease subunit A
LRRTARFERGQLLHALLQHLPDLPPASRLPAARRHLLARGLTPGEQDAALGELVAVLDAPALADAFGPGSRAEVPLTGLIGDQVVGGLVDRLVVRPERVLLVDYKTNRRPPGRPDRVPVAYLRQMAAYRAVLTKLYPERSVRCVLVWTVGADVMDLPPALLDRFAPGARQTAGEAA